jgi:iron complex outermembrane receptor protein
MLAAASIVLLGVSLGAAEEERERPRESGLEERVEVRAAAPAEEDVAAFATVIETRDLAARGEDLGDVLRRVPGARVRDYGGLGSYSTVSLRASTAEQVVVLVDGVPQNRALGGPVDLSTIPATQIERVTVYRGFGPAVHGLGGIGGVVDVRTRAPEEGVDGRVDLLAGELDSRRLSAGWSVPAGASGHVRIGAEGLTGDGDFRFLDTGVPFDTSDDFLRRRSNNDVEQGSLLFQGVWDAVGSGRLRVAARAQRREAGVPGLAGFPSETARLDERLDDLNASWTLRRGGAIDGIDLMIDGFDQEIDFADLDGDLGVGVQDQTTELSGGGLTGVLRAAHGRQRFTVRLAARREEAEVTDRALTVQDRGGAERDLLSLTVEDTVTLGRLVLAPSLRFEQRSDEFASAGGGALPPPAPDAREDEWAGKLGVSFTVNTRTSIRGSAGRFHRSPNLLELFGDRGAVVGNPELVAETGLAAEVGVAHARSTDTTSVDLEVVAYARDADDLILLVPNSQATSVPRNIGGAEVLGIEAAVTLRLPWRLWVDAGGTLQRTEDTSGGFSDGEPLVYQPERLGYLGLGWSRGRFAARWDVTYVGENPSDVLDTPELRMPSRVTHDANLRLEIGAGLELGLDVRNVFDKRVRDVARYPLPDRVALAYVGWRNGGAR